MPAEQHQLEYYHYYRASQRRVQQWVKKTSRELEVDTGSGTGSGLLAGGNGNGKEPSRRRTSQRRSSSSSYDPIHSSRSRSHSTRKKAKTLDNDQVRGSRKSLYYTSDPTISSLLPFGLFPLIFALTPPSVATLFSATILLAGYYFCVDYSKQESISEKL